MLTASGTQTDVPMHFQNSGLFGGSRIRRLHHTRPKASHSPQTGTARDGPAPQSFMDFSSIHIVPQTFPGRCQIAGMSEGKYTVFSPVPVAVF